jgi:DsbC/DsbD-like thiol-disulfide interchange protein
MNIPEGIYRSYFVLQTSYFTSWCVCLAAAIAGLTEPVASSLQAPRSPAVAGTRVESAYASLVILPWRADAKGQIGLRFEVEPAAGIRIYAPGQKGYEPPSVTFSGKDGVKAGRLDLPTPETYVFEPTGERLLVYQRRFTAVQHATLAPDGEASRTGRIAATFRYQACDDAICFKPETVAVVWTLGLASGGQL